MNRRSRGWRWRAPLLALTLSIATTLALAGAASAHHHKGEHDFGPAGTISSYDADSGVLTIDLAKGGGISALVTDRTDISVGGGCDKGEGRHGRKSRHARHDRALRRWGDGGDHHGWGRHHGWDDDHSGSTDDLVPGTVVDDAVLVLVDGTAVYAKVDLETPSSGAAN